MKCKVCGTSENIIYSGVDAFVLGVEVEKTCYPCGNAAHRKASNENPA